MRDTEFLPRGFILPDGTARGRLLSSGSEWQIFTTNAKTSALAVLPCLHEKWLVNGLIGENLFIFVNVNGGKFFVLAGKKDYLISSVQYGPYPETNTDAKIFAVTLREMRKVYPHISFHDSVYLEQFSLFLPTYTNTAPLSDDVVLGSWLSSGVHISASDERLRKIVTWLNYREIQSVLNDAGITAETDPPKHEDNFSLPGRPVLEAFFNEHVIDIIRNEDRYRRAGIYFPSAIVLYGPPGCGKTFAVEQLVKFLDWPHYSIDSGTIGSPYIHDTSRKTAEIFNEAAKNAPSVVVIDEMDAFLSDRSAQNSGIHHTEEVSEFLRRIPEAPKQHVLVIAMTNRLEAIDPAVLRHGRFDHVIEVDMPSTEEVESLLHYLFAGLPLSGGVNLRGLAERLAGHSLADAAFIVREAGRLSVREGKEIIDSEVIEAAYTSLYGEKDNTRKIGFYR